MNFKTYLPTEISINNLSLFSFQHFSNYYVHQWNRSREYFYYILYISFLPLLWAEMRKDLHKNVPGRRIWLKLIMVIFWVLTPHLWHCVVLTKACCTFFSASVHLSLMLFGDNTSQPLVFWAGFQLTDNPQSTWDKETSHQPTILK